MRAWRTWLQPGMRVKRWVLMGLVGLTMMVLAVAVGLTWGYRTYYWELSQEFALLEPLTLQFIPHPWRELLVFLVGVSLIVYASWRLNRSLIYPLLEREASGRALAQILREHHLGPTRPERSVVAIGGGTGLSSLLRGLKHGDVGITAIVTVADDGGSTGRIRVEFDMPAPGDIRNCIAALADDEALVTRLFQYRFDKEGSNLRGHSFGNLFITALTQITGSFERAVMESSQVLAIRGRVLPSTLENVRMSAELIDGTMIHGESAVGQKSAPIKRIFLTPRRPEAHTPSLSAILNADLIILGPGSLYTSVLPNLMVDGIIEAIRWSPGKVVYVCNVATQPGETDHFTAADHIRVIMETLGPDVLDVALVNSSAASAAAADQDLAIEPVLGTDLDQAELGVRIVSRDLASERNPLRHDSDKLAAALLEIAREPHAPRLVTMTDGAIGASFNGRATEPVPR